MHNYNYLNIVTWCELQCYSLPIVILIAINAFVLSVSTLFFFFYSFYGVSEKLPNAHTIRDSRTNAQDRRIPAPRVCCLGEDRQAYRGHSDRCQNVMECTYGRCREIYRCMSDVKSHGQRLLNGMSCPIGVLVPSIGKETRQQYRRRGQPFQRWWWWWYYDDNDTGVSVSYVWHAMISVWLAIWIWFYL